MRDVIATYLADVEREYQTGLAKEHAYRASLEKLLQAAGENLNAVNEPKRSAIGAPDFQVLHGQTTVGFVEAKDIDISLDMTENSEQLKRYRNGFANLILTDYLEFRWYVNGDHRQTVRIATANGRIRGDQTQYAALESLLREFVVTITPTVQSAQELARRMANIAQLIRTHILNDLAGDAPDTSLTAQRNAFAQTLLPDIDNAQFADMYAQTLAYGLFAARFNYKGDPETFHLDNAGRHIPATNPFLGKLFRNIRQNLGERIVYLGETLADLLAHTDTDEILKDFGRSTRQEDPVVHFYETFLREYDPALREQRGVYYTPEPVVSYIVRSVDHILRERFGRGMGLADEETLVLDPATGTGTFLYFTIKHIYDTYFTGQRGAWKGYVKESLLKRIFGFELLMAPYAVAHMKLGLLLQQPAEHETATYEFTPGERLGVYLTNTLEEQFRQDPLPFAEYITEEANEATAVKRDKPIMVVLGNPPYSGQSSNKGEWIVNLVRDYYQVDGKPLGERNPKWLLDDYVKFIRFGQWRIRKTGSGILAFVTNNGFLDNPTFRGMRQSLLNEFSEIYILNLHGSTTKKEKAPDGSPDANVFDIQQGVSIAIFVKEEGKEAPAEIFYNDLWGRREDKYTYLLNNYIDDTAWSELSPQTPFYLFIPQNTELLPEFEQGWNITEMMPLNSVGIATARDKLTIHWSPQEVMETINNFSVLPIESARATYRLGKDARDWKVSLAQADIQEHGLIEDYVVPIHYRPFDTRFTYYTGQTRGFICMPRPSVMRHLLPRFDNFALITSRMTKGETFRHAQVTQNITEVICMSSKTSNNGFVFPLYLYPEQREGELFGIEDDGSDWPLSKKGRRPNLSPAFVNDMAGRLGLEFVTEGTGDLENTFGPEDVFHYAYAVFHSPTYRERYAEFLKIDFPRLPLTSDIDLFRALCGLGQQLVALHLMKHPALNRLITQYPVEGDNVVAATGGYPKFEALTSPPPAPPHSDIGEGSSGRVWINKTQYVAGVPADVWEFHVGGYQVLDKWLKDRRGRALNFQDLRHYQQIVVALRETMRLMEAIDDAIPGWPLA